MNFYIVRFKVNAGPQLLNPTYTDFTMRVLAKSKEHAQETAKGKFYMEEYTPKNFFISNDISITVELDPSQGCTFMILDPI